MKYLIYLSALLLFTSCKKENVVVTTANLSRIQVGNGNFSTENGDDFFPWGFNYTNPIEVGLIEDNWSNEEVWKTIQEDFNEMVDLGANVTRIHLQYHKFMIDANTPNQSALNRLEELVLYADEIGIYLDITGLGAYRKNEQPSFYTSMTDEERWNTQKIFWKSIAETVGGNPAVFAFNLMNEPVVSVRCDTISVCDWTPGDGIGGYHFVQNITRTPGLEYELTFRNWMAEMTESIRSVDDETLITVGFLDLGAYSRFSTDLDYLSPHMYPKSGEIQKSIDKLLDNVSEVPSVIEEISNLYCNVTELEEFLNGIDGTYNGLMGHYFGRTIDELDEKHLGQAIQKNFLEFFILNNPN